MVSQAIKFTALASGLVLAFIFVSGLLRMMIPQPHGAIDNFVIGCSATFVCLLMILGRSLQGSYRT